MINRREFMVSTAALGIAGRAAAATKPASSAILRKIPVERRAAARHRHGHVADLRRRRGRGGSRAPLAAVLAELVAGGGTVIDSSPMYGRAEQVTGDLLRGMKPAPKIFAATKVWTTGTRGRHRADEPVVRAPGGQANGSHAGSQPAGLADPSAGAARMEGRGTDPVHRHHDLESRAVRRHGGRDARRAARFRAVQLQRRRAEAGEGRCCRSRATRASPR